MDDGPEFLKTKRTAVLTSDEHARGMLTFLHECWSKQHYCDVTVVVGDQSFGAHRMVLAMVSDYLRVYLQLDGKDVDVVKLPGVSAELFQVILEYAYSGVFYAEDCDIEALAISADYLGISALKGMCEQHLVKLVNTNTCFYYLMFSDTYTLVSLADVCKNMFKKNFIVMSNTSEFLMLPSKHLLALLDDDKLNIYTSKGIPMATKERERLLYKTTLRYIHGNNKDGRLPQRMRELLAAVKLPEIEHKYLMKKLKRYSSFERKDSDVLELIQLSQRFDEKSPSFPKGWYTSRLPGFIKFSSGPMYADNDRAGRDMFDNCCPKDLSNPHKRLSRISVRLRSWDGRLVIGGFRLCYDDDTCSQGGIPCVEDSDSGDQHDVVLQKNEVIVKVNVNAGFLLDCIQFTTNLHATYGPFGGDGGGSRSETGSGDGFFLHSMSFSSIETQNSLAPVYLQCHWVKLE